VTDGYDDDALRARLRASDPARTLPPADTDRVARLLRETMHTDEQTPGAEPTPRTDLGPATTREAGARGRSPLTWVVAAAAVVLIAGAALFGVLRHDDTTTVPSAGPSGAPQQTTTQLSAPQPEAYRARCMVPSAATLSQQTLAFDGTVRSIADGLVTLAPTHFYAGDPADVVTVRAPRSQLPALVSAVRFEQGGRYLVSASHGTVSVCGLSAPWSADLAGLYHRAFEGR
jgi:hypothetical protein